MDAGHSGSSGRFSSIKETARDFAFIIDTVISDEN
jgi:protease II